MHSERNVVKRVAGVRTVPVVYENTGVTMAESANIVDHPRATDGGGDRPDATASAGGDD